MILRGGANIYPAEVENVLSGIVGILDVAVVGIPHDVLEKSGFPGYRWNSQRGQSQGSLPARLVLGQAPTPYRLSGTLPRNPNGKVLKRELREYFQPGAGE